MKRTRQQFARAMRAIVCGEEWVIKKVIKKVETNSFGNQTIYAGGLSTLERN